VGRTAGARADRGHALQRGGAARRGAARGRGTAPLRTPDRGDRPRIARLRGSSWVLDSPVRGDGGRMLYYPRLDCIDSVLDGLN